jgi:hypothetical protein
MPVDTLIFCGANPGPESRVSVQVIWVSLVLRSTVAVRADMVVDREDGRVAVSIFEVLAEHSTRDQSRGAGGPSAERSPVVT